MVRIGKNGGKGNTMFGWWRNHIESRRSANAITDSLGTLGHEMTLLLRSGPNLCNSPLVALFFLEVRGAHQAVRRGDLTKAEYLRDEARKSKTHVARIVQRRAARKHGVRRYQ